MIYSLDNFIDNDLFNIATKYLDDGDFIKHSVGEKDFYVQESPELFDNYVLSKLSITEGKELENILSFFRVSTDKVDTHITDEVYDDMIRVDSENLDMWRLVSVSGYEQNRLISYPATYFHSKYPNKSWEAGRQVYVMFYKFKN